MYGVEIFWNLIQDKSGLPEKHFQLVFNSMLILIFKFEELKEVYLKKCFEYLNKVTF